MEYFDVLNECGDFTGEIKSREECHTKGLWHKAVVIFIVSSDNKKVLLQQRSSTKKLWPNFWDITAGGHVLSEELGWEAALREAQEEIGISINKNDIEFIGATTSENKKGEIINRHFNEYYIVHKDVDVKNIILQEEEVQDIKWLSKEEISERVEANFKDLTDKIECWHYLLKYLEIMDKRSNI